jgi:NAD(P)-dependent dehydrogenase (short-subunit alcohol dehydrogenase family)
MNLGLRGKVALVTGDSDGLGLATARRLAVEGAAARSKARPVAPTDRDSRLSRSIIPLGCPA